ncbi:hypothetical protein P3X46_011416 [Hevea brasiliensis]|uniref:Pentacotripeptide-repeat region of PRORP domain-containing protein n=1 Tax=Hevea brasiliensis TaxID=3981 RepID=A0ABQ9M7A8_HEVBR|nr:hypothetical protein P3X46_011416 [Hevea brasiliensis]
MWRTTAAKTTQVARNFGTTVSFDMVGLFLYPFQSHFSTRVSLLPCPNFRFLSHLSVNPCEIETEHSSLDSAKNGDDATQVDHFASANDSSVVFMENNDTQFQNFAYEGIPALFSQVLCENGDYRIENFTPESDNISMPDQFSRGLVEEVEGGKEEGGVYEMDTENSADGSLESTLDSMGLDLHDEFVVKAIEIPLILGDNLIKFFKWAIKEPDINATTRLVDVLVRAICSDLKKKDAYALWDLIREVSEKDNVVLNVEILNRLIALFSKRGKGKATLEVFNKFGGLWVFLCRRSFFDWAWSVCEKMLNAEALPDSEKVGKIICWFCKGSRANDAHMIYMLAKEKNKYPSQSAVTFLICLLSRKDETVKLCLDMLDSFSRETRKYAIKPFSSVFCGLCRIKDFDRAKMLLTNMIDEGPPPGNAVFNTIINGYSKCGYMKGAMEMKKLMERRGLKPDLFTYTVIVSGYASGVQMEKACKILSEAKNKHSKLSPFDKALELLTEMKEFGVQPNVDKYNKLIQSLCLKADWETAEKVLEKMEEDGLHLNGITKGLTRAVKKEGLQKEVSVET